MDSVEKLVQRNRELLAEAAVTREAARDAIWAARENRARRLCRLWAAQLRETIQQSDAPHDPL